MSLISAITYFIPLQIWPARPQQQVGVAEGENYYCVSPENETDRNAAFVEFARNRCQISEFDIDAVPDSILESFSPAAPRNVRRNRWESLADYFDSTWLLILFWPVAVLIRALAGPDYCDGALIPVNETELCQSLREAVVPPEPEPSLPDEEQRARDALSDYQRQTNPNPNQYQSVLNLINQVRNEETRELLRCRLGERPRLQSRPEQRNEPAPEPEPEPPPVVVPPRPTKVRPIGHDDNNRPVVAPPVVVQPRPPIEESSGWRDRNL